MKSIAFVTLLVLTLVGCSPSNPSLPDPEPIPPTPEPPVSTQLTIEQAAQYGYQAGFRCEPGSLDTAVAIAIAESSLRPLNENLHPEYGEREEGWVHRDRGLMQISSYWWPQYEDDLVYTPLGAFQAALEISEDGSRWDLWNTYENGVVDIHLNQPYRGWPAVRPAIEEWCNNE